MCPHTALEWQTACKNIIDLSEGVALDVPMLYRNLAVEWNNGYSLSQTRGMVPIPNRRHSFLYGATEEEQERILKQKVDQVLTVFYADKDNASVTDRSLFLLPCRVSIQRHNLWKEMLWIQTLNLSLQAQNPAHRSYLEDGAWLRLAQRFEQMEGRQPSVRSRSS